MVFGADIDAASIIGGAVVLAAVALGLGSRHASARQTAPRA
jgi:hypothetical protein